jgi:hypothetical protein
MTNELEFRVGAKGGVNMPLCAEHFRMFDVYELHFV